MPRASDNEISHLAKYRAKRSFDDTAEPAGEPEVSRPGVFVVHLHAARHLHYDLRLELDGVLRSWAVPKGFSADPQEKRLAVETEDHPVEYADFEGLIPQGNYGAGAMIVWDRGLWLPLLDPRTGDDKGKLLFELKGYKLRGVWTLVRGKKGSREWLLIKKPDAWADPERAFPEASVLSGLTVDELARGESRAAEVRAELERLGAPRRPVAVEEVEPMLAATADGPFSDPGWVFELKYDGFRLLAGRHDGRPILRYRSGLDATRTFPELARAVAALPYGELVLDGEVAVLDDDGRPSFGRLQRRGRLTRRPEVERAAIEHSATFHVFDLLAFEGFDLRPLPLTARKALLGRILPAAGPLRFVEDVPERGEELYAAVARLGLEGVVGKRAASPYRGGRFPDWKKVRSDRAGDFAVVGLRPSPGQQSPFGALHLAAWEEGRLVYAGRVGTGFTQRQMDEIRAALEPARRPGPACSGLAARGRGDLWVEPELVVEVRYKEWPAGGHLRHPVFLRLRADKTVAECVREAATAEAPEPAPATALASLEPAPAAPASAPVKLTNLQKVFWPEEGYTKGDLVAYYRAAAPWILPYLADRPLVLDRYPDGIRGESFYQKHAPDSAPEWIRTVPVWSADSGRTIEYLVCEDAGGLLYAANLGAIPLHVWSSRVASLDRPDWCILDLDAKQATFQQAVEVALAARALLDELGLPSFPKTSGGTGLHVLVPLGGRLDHEQSRQLAELLARLVAAALPETATTARAIAARGGRIYVDYLQNGRGKLLVAPWSARPFPGAPVSTPLSWEEVGPGLDPRAFTLKTVPRRLDEMGEDPLRPVLETVPDLGAALERLAARMA